MTEQAIRTDGRAMRDRQHPNASAGDRGGAHLGGRAPVRLAGVKLAFSAAVVAISLGQPSWAAPRQALPIVLVLDGECSKLVIGGTPSPCTGHLLNTEHADGRLGFSFVAADGAILTFTGAGTQVHPDFRTALQSLDAVIVKSGKQTRRPTAVGSCRFTDPYAGVPSDVTCRAEADDGMYEASFRSNGAKPVRLDR